MNSLGTLRNKFAHRLSTELGKNEVSALYMAFDGDAKQIIQDGYRKVKKEFGMKSPKSVTKLEPRQQFTLIVVAMHNMLESAKSEFGND